MKPLLSILASVIIVCAGCSHLSSTQTNTNGSITTTLTVFTLFDAQSDLTKYAAKQTTNGNQGLYIGSLNQTSQLNTNLINALLQAATTSGY